MLKNMILKNKKSVKKKKIKQFSFYKSNSYNKTSKGEAYILTFLNNNSINFNREQEFEGLFNPITNQKLRFDFYLPKFKTCIEFNGIQHYEYVEDFHGTNKAKGLIKLKNQKLKDKIKKEYALSKNLKLIVIKYTKINQIDKILSKALNITTPKVIGKYQALLEKDSKIITKNNKKYKIKIKEEEPYVFGKVIVDGEHLGFQG